MGLISHNAAITPAEAEHGHRITYSLDTLERDAVAGGLRVVHRSGIFFKALANFQWDQVIPPASSTRPTSTAATGSGSATRTSARASLPRLRAGRPVAHACAATGPDTRGNGSWFWCQSLPRAVSGQSR
jgi:hypothetical protein